jgi:hypothetical protein
MRVPRSTKPMREDFLAEWKPRTGAAQPVANETSPRPASDGGMDAQSGDDQEDNPTRYRMERIELRPLRGLWSMPSYTQLLDVLFDGKNPSFLALVFVDLLVIVKGRNRNSSSQGCECAHSGSLNNTTKQGTGLRALASRSSSRWSSSRTTSARRSQRCAMRKLQRHLKGPGYPCCPSRIRGRYRRLALGLHLEDRGVPHGHESEARMADGGGAAAYLKVKSRIWSIARCAAQS